ncbi:MAG TPA: hypothetical protein VEV19_07165 [Ktedonobacteraceae bacterium]|nr:hypothetical protein [Ktedonobacteraceae bacterium]
MNCLQSMALTDEELLGFALDGEALSAQKQAHLEQCEVCQQRLARYKQINASLVSHLYRRLCPDSLQLSLYCSGELPEVERIHIAAHVLDCPLCATEVADTRRFLRDAPLRMPTAVRSPVEVARRFVEELLATSPLQHVFATLVRQQAQLVVRNGSRPASNAWPRQYRAEAVDVSLHLSRSSNGAYMLLGILTSANSAEAVDAFEGVKAELYPTPFERGNGDGDGIVKTPLRQASVDDLGNIVFSNVPVGEYIMIMHLPTRNVIIEDITIEHG